MIFPPNPDAELKTVLPQLEIEIPILSSQISLDFDQFPEIHVLSPNVLISIAQTCIVLLKMHIKMSRALLHVISA